MRTIVAYKSKTGFTAKYAQWIAEELAADIFEASKVSAGTLESYDTVIYGGGLYASRINGIELVTRNLRRLEGKKVVVFATGASPAREETVSEILKANFTPGQREQIRFFYLRGGFDYRRLPPFFKVLMLPMKWILKGKKALTPDEQGMLAAYDNPADFTRRENISALVSSVKETRKINIAIDGPAGSGKSTIARLLAEALGYIYIDTGAMYRAVALKAARENVDWGDGAGVTKIAREARLALKGLARTPDGGWQTRICLDGEDVSEAIRDVDIARGASKIGVIKGVREALVAQQRIMAAGGGVVMDGRDIGTVVLPEAEAKIFLTATLKERTRRRQKELAAKGVRISFRELLAQIKDRDKTDSEREVSPLKQARDAVLVDSTKLAIEQVRDKILAIVEDVRHAL
ncbi:MAG: (d)CMP kinase [Bacillota bacterium]